ncbi:MAG: class I SAM-dependent methyltransferase [Candidatus Andersenbacteria bacterium]|nr:class I SAM-dependent methyltransferase [Candidatus Andersenbacteria bacterium]
MDSLPQDHFNFGKNWLAYSTHAFDSQAFQSAQASLRELIGEPGIAGKTFLDIGSGSGIFALAAQSLGAWQVKGLDISPESVRAAVGNARNLDIDEVEFVHGSILSVPLAPLGTYDIVYSWGVLHHTGNMWLAIERASHLVKPGGLFVIAIYNKHWSSRLWLAVKYLYNRAPQAVQTLMVGIFSIIIFVAKFLATGSNPLKRRRGMNFYYDVIDWIGGYPYEYASKDEVVEFVGNHNFRLKRFVPAPVETGASEFVFEKASEYVIGR